MAIDTSITVEGDALDRYLAGNAQIPTTTQEDLDFTTSTPAKEDDAPTTIADTTEDIVGATSDPLEFLGEILAQIQTDLHAWGGDNGVANNIMDGWLFTPQIQTLFVSTVQQTLKNAETERANILSFVDYEDLSPENQKQLDRGLLGSPTGIEFIVDRVWDALSAQWGGLGTRPRAKVKTTGTGRRRATPAEIRARFDLDELTELANNIWRGKLLEEPDNARAMASAYVDAVVASKGEQRIDFTQFITERARATSRYASIYKNKPESVSDEQFLQPYFQAATQTLRPGNAARVAIGGAQLGMDAQTFAGRISREDEVTGSAPYVNQLYNRMSAVKGVFRG